MLLALGLLLTLPLSFGTVTLGPITLLAALDAARAVAGDPRPAVRLHGRSCRRCSSTTTGEATARWFRRFPYNRTVALPRGLFAAGCVCGGVLTRNYVRNGFRLLDGSPVNNLGVTGLLLDDRSAS